MLSHKPYKIRINIKWFIDGNGRSLGNQNCYWKATKND